MKRFCVLPIFSLLFLFSTAIYTQENSNREPTEESKKKSEEKPEKEIEKRQNETTRWQMLRYDGISAFGGVKKPTNNLLT